MLTPFLRASGADHFIGNFPTSVLALHSSLFFARPKSATFATQSSEISTFLEIF